MDHSSADVLQLVRRVVRLHEVDECFDQPVRPTAAPQQVVDVVQALGQVVLLASGAAARDLDHPAGAEARKLGAARAGFEPGLVSDLPRGRRLPQRSEREIDTPFLCRERFEVALEVLRVVIDQIEQICHEIAERQPGAEASHDRDQAEGCRRSESPANESFRPLGGGRIGSPTGRRIDSCRGGAACGPGRGRTGRGPGCRSRRSGWSRSRTR